jgi:hypothetical protein
MSDNVNCVNYPGGAERLGPHLATSSRNDSPDTFRMRIWEEVAGVELTIYDNQLGGQEDADPTSVLGGGSIVIHK